MLGSIDNNIYIRTKDGFKSVTDMGITGTDLLSALMLVMMGGVSEESKAQIRKCFDGGDSA